MGAQQAERDADGEEQPTCTRSKCIGLRVALARERRAGRLMVMAHGESEAGSTGLLRLDLLRSHPRLFDNDMTRDVCQGGLGARQLYVSTVTRYDVVGG